MVGAVQLVTLAEISGVFVGFGALISLTSRDKMNILEFGVMRAAVTAGMTTMVGALIPLGFAAYGIEGAALWRVSSAAFLAIEAVFLVDNWRRPDNREFLLAGSRQRPVAFWLFWLLLELPMVLPLLLVLLGVFPGLGQGLYTTAVLVSLLQAVWALWQVIYSLSGSLSGSPERGWR
jgi:hypothetical protein